MMLSSKRVLLLLASSLGVLALAGGIIVATPEEARGLLPEAYGVAHYGGPVAKEQHEERKHHGGQQGKDPLAIAIAYPDRVARATKRAERQAEPASSPVAPSSTTSNYASGNSVWDDLAQCEANGNWAINTGNGYYGGLQFSLSTWRAVGGVGYPHEASREEQIHRGEILLQSSGWGAWPSCSSQLGLR
jgi:hypothetical protein